MGSFRAEGILRIRVIRLDLCSRRNFGSRWGTKYKITTPPFRSHLKANWSC